jgi:polyhydroxyalkanoate synthase
MPATKTNPPANAAPPPSGATAPPTPAITDEEMAQRVRREVERAMQRQIKGLDFLRSGDPPAGLTPKDVIYTRGTLQLFHYKPMADEVYRVPVLLVMSLVSKAYILDLTPGQSLVEFLLKQGFDVFMIDWGIPRPEDSRLKLEDYVLDFIPDCISKVQEETGETDINMVGYCMGGLLALLYASLFPEGPVKNLACFTTPVNYEGMGLQRRFADPRWFDVDRVVDTMGNVPGDMMYQSFQMLRPASQGFSQVKLWDNMWDDEFVKSWRLFDRWGADQIPFPGECFRQTTKDLMWDNKLVKGELMIGGRNANLANITVPVLHVAALHDHIVPSEASKDLIELVGSEDKQEIVMKGGHVSLVAGGNAMFRLWPQLDRWLAQRSV